MNTIALTFFCPVFLHFCFFGFLLCPVFLGGLFLRGMKKQKKTKFKTKQQKKQKRKKDHKMQIRRPLSLVTKKNTTTQKQNNTNEFFKLERNNTRRKTNKNKNIKHKNQTTLLTNIAQKTPELQGKQPFFRD